MAFFGLAPHLSAQQREGPAPPVPGSLPDAPVPQIQLAASAPVSIDPQTPQAQSAQPPASSSAPAQSTSGQNQNPPQQAPAAGAPAAGTTSAPGNGAAQTDASSQSSTQQPVDQKTQHEKAEEELQQQEHQRVAGVMATFNTTSNPDAVPLSSGQKYRLFFKSAFDPWPFGLNVFVAGFNQAADADPEWGQGVQGYAKRYGAAYSDYFIGNFFGNAVLPSMLREDPRFFQKGSGSFMDRFLWAAASTVWCKRDNGRWGPNYANVGGNLIGAAIARTYYPTSERTVADTIDDGLTVSAEGIVGAEVIEFWPDMVRHHQRKKAEKLAREADAAAKQNKQHDENQKPPE
jgi:hypothetical protein